MKNKPDRYIKYEISEELIKEIIKQEPGSDAERGLITDLIDIYLSKTHKDLPKIR